MSDRITEKKLMMKLLNHNAWTNGPLLDIDSLGAGGGMGEHLILFNTQKYLGPLMTKSQLWDLIGAIGTYEYNSNLQRKNTPIKVFFEEYERISNGGSVNSSFMYNVMHEQKEFNKVIKGSDFEKEARK